jgi:hypothetical protein
MTLSIFLIGVFLLGFIVLQSFFYAVSIYEKIGLSFILGLGILIIYTIILTFFNIPINSFSVGCGLIFLIILCSIPAYLKKKLIKIEITEIDKIKFTYSWFFFIGLTIYFLYGIAYKNLFWPLAEYDSMTGFDLQAKMIAQEGTMNTSIFKYPSKSSYDISRFFYPPLSACAFAFVYLFDGDNSKIVILLLFISLLISFYGLLRKFVPDYFAILITFFLMVTPEMFSHASLGLTNLPNAIYTSLSIICLYLWTRNNEKVYLIISLLLMVFTEFSRSDSIVFWGGAGLIFLLHFLKTKEWKLPVLYLTIALIPFISWSLYVKWVIGADNSEFFIKTLFWDAEKFSMVFGKCLTVVLGNSVYYGLTFYLFLVVLALSTVDVIQEKHPLAIYILVAWFVYTLLFYQMDYNFAGNMDSYINASYKRGMFNFVPLCWFFIAISPFTEKWIGKLNKFLTP